MSYSEQNVAYFQWRCRAACYAREARVEKSRRRAQLVVVNIVRRDTLAVHHVVASGLTHRVRRAGDTPNAA